MTEEISNTFKEFVFNDLEYTVQLKERPFRLKKTISKKILHNLSGRIDAGDFVALLGASGAGKTTLLNILSGKIKGFQGDIRINGEPIATSSVLKQESCYIQHDDVFFGNLTVKEHLKQQALLTINKSKEECEKIAESVIEHFNLSHVANSYIGDPSQQMGRGLSGGERKRLSIASVLIRNPSLIFADEPTSGLDSFMSYSVALTLRKLTESGRTVISSIHQPSSDILFLFKKVMLLAEGRLIYYGPTQAVLCYFNSILELPLPLLDSPADFLLESLAVNNDDNDQKRLNIIKWEQKWRESNVDFFKTQDLSIETLSKKYPFVFNPHNRGSLMTKLSEIQLVTDKNNRPPKYKVANLLFSRTILTNIRDKSMFRAHILEIFFTALITCICFFRLKETDAAEKSRVIILLILNISFMLCYLTVTKFITELKPIKKEIEDRLYTPTTYFTSKLFSDFIIDQITPICLFIPVWFICGINDTFWRFLVGIIYMLLYSEAIKGFAYIIAASVNNVEQSTVIIPVFLLLFVLCSTIFTKKNVLAPPMLLFYYTTPFNYIFSALLRASGLHLTSAINLYEFDPRDIRWFYDALALLIWVFVGRLIGLIIFHYKMKIKLKL